MKPASEPVPKPPPPPACRYSGRLQPVRRQWPEWAEDLWEWRGPLLWFVAAVAFLLLVGCSGKDKARPGTAAASATDAQATAAAVEATATGLHQDAVAASISASALERLALAYRDAGDLAGAVRTQLAAAVERGRAEALSSAATDADRRAMDARSLAIAAAESAEHERQEIAEAERLAGIRSDCEKLAAAMAIIGLMAGAALGFLERPRWAIVAATGGPIAAVAVVTAGASLPWIYDSAPWVLLALLVAVAGAVVWVCRDLRTITRADAVSALPKRLQRAVTRIGWTP